MLGDETMRVVIVGGVAGGASTAARLRRLDENAEIIIFERTNYISYANCGLPYYIGDVITDTHDLTLQTPESFHSRFNVDVRVNHEVINIDTLNKRVEVKNLLTSDIDYVGYDKLVLSPGATPILPPFYHIDKRIMTLRTVEDTFKIKLYVEGNSPKTAMIIGGGYIGVELAENLTKLGIEVSIVDMQPQLLNVLDSDMISFVHKNVVSKGVKLHLGHAVKEVKVSDRCLTVCLDNGCQIDAEVIICAVGVKPESKLAEMAGLKLGVNGSIIVDEHMQTSNPDIYAVGDAVQVKNIITGEDTLLPLAGPANKQGRIAADNLCGIDSVYQGSQGTNILQVFDLTVAETGLNEKVCQKNNICYDKVILSPLSHASYYPNAKIMTLKLIFNKNDYQILGAQIVGYLGVDKRIDVIATAIKAKMKAYELKDLELAYAPPYSSAKDPVNLAGYIVDNIKNGLVKQFEYKDLNRLKEEDNILLDTRTKEEYTRGHVEGFINIPLDDLRVSLDLLPKDKKVYVMCQSGLRSYIATRILMQNGYDAYNFIGGYRLYSSIVNDEILAFKSLPCGLEK